MSFDGVPAARRPPATDGRQDDGRAAPSGGARLSPADFARLFEENWRTLWCAAVAVLNDRTMAQDCVQQAAVIGLERLDGFDAGTNFVAWMTQIVRHVSMNEARKRRRRRTSTVETEALDARAGHEPPDDLWRAVTSRGRVAEGQDSFDDGLSRALDRLDDTARSCLLLRVVADLPYREIAQALGIPEGTAASHVHRARRALRESLAGASGVDGGEGERSGT